VTIRNKTTTGEAVFLTANSGINFYIGNNPDADGMSAVPVGSRWEKLKRKASVADVSPRSISHAGRSAWYVAEVFCFARTEPRAFLTLQLRKLYLFWSSLEIRNNIDIYFFQQWSGLLSLSVGRLGTIGLPYGLLAPLALTAIFIPPSRITVGGQRRARTLLVLYVFSYMAAVCAFFVCTRFRMPVLSVLICFAADAAVRSVGFLKQQGLRGLLEPARPLAAVLTFLLLAVLLNLDLGGVRHTLPSARDELNVAASLRARGDHTEAMRAVSRGLAIDQSDPDAYHLLGVMYGETGHLDEAVEAFREALVHDPEFATAHHALGMTYRRQQKDWPALQSFERAVHCDPWFPQARVDLGTAYLRRGEFAKAAENYEVALMMDPSRDDIRYWLAEARRRVGR
jgi:tetratricopeptide (TPR) repeat protein